MLLLATVVAGASTVRLELRCHRASAEATCVLVERRFFGSSSRPLNVAPVDGIEMRDDPGFTLLDTERALRTGRSDAPLPLPRRAVWISERGARREGDLETDDFGGFFRHLVPSRWGEPCDWSHGCDPEPIPKRWDLGRGERFDVFQTTEGAGRSFALAATISLPLLAFLWVVIAERGARRFAVVVDPGAARIEGRSRGLVGRTVAHATAWAYGFTLQVVERPRGRPRLALRNGGEVHGLIEGTTPSHARALRRLCAELAASVEGIDTPQPSTWRRWGPSVALALAATLLLAGRLLAPTDVPNVNARVLLRTSQTRCSTDGASLDAGESARWLETAGRYRRAFHITPRGGEATTVEAYVDLRPGEEVTVDCDALWAFRVRRGWYANEGCAFVSAAGTEACEDPRKLWGRWTPITELERR